MLNLLLCFIFFGGMNNATSGSSPQSHGTHSGQCEQASYGDLKQKEAEEGELQYVKEELCALLEAVPKDANAIDLNLVSFANAAPKEQRTLSRSEVEELVVGIDRVLASTASMQHEMDVPSFFQEANMRDASIEVADQSDNIFLQLPLEDWEKRNIRKIVGTMGDKNVFQLLLEKRTMEKRGKEINHVHPMRFIGYVFSEPELKRSMHSIRKSHFKWKGFIDGFSKRMKEEGRRNNLMRFVPGFCQYLRINPDRVSKHIEEVDCDGLVKALMH